jgi:hypothetical protein
METHTHGREFDAVGRPLIIGDVVIYAVGRAPLKSGVVVRFDRCGGVFIRIPRKTRDDRPMAPGTVHIDSLSHVVAVPHALRTADARRLRQHVSRPPRPAELRRRALRAARYFRGGTFTPEMTLIEAGISDTGQSEYQRKMSMLLAGRESATER